MDLGGDYGISQALAFRTNAGEAANNEINDLKYSIQQRKENEALAMAKAKMLSEDIEFQQGSNPIDSAIIKEENTQLLRDIGKYDTDNKHDILTNPYKMGQRKLMVKRYAQTDAVLRSVAWKTAVDQYNKYTQTALKDPSKYNLDQLKDFKVKMNNYGKDENGNPLPKDQIKPLVFTPPEDIPDFDELHRKAGDSVDPDLRTNINNGRLGAYTKTASDASLTRKAEEMYARHKSAYDYTYKNVPDKVQAIKNSIKPFAKSKDFDGYEDVVGNHKQMALYDAKLKGAAEMSKKSPSFDIYKNMVLNSKDISPSDGDPIAAAFGSTPTVTYRSADGSNVTESGNRFYYTRLVDRGGKEQGIKDAYGHFFKPIKYGKDNNIVENEGVFGGGKLVVKPEFRDAYEIFYPEPNSKGEAEPVLKVHARTEVNANSPEAASKYNAAIKATTKQRDRGPEGSMLEQDVFVDDNGDKWIMGSNGKYIKV